MLSCTYWRTLEVNKNLRENIRRLKLREITKRMMTQIAELVQKHTLIAKNKNSELDPQIIHNPSC